MLEKLSFLLKNVLKNIAKMLLKNVMKNVHYIRRYENTE